MAENDILKGKKILAVDDESDVLDTLKEMLDECDMETADTYEFAKELLESRVYDAAILDIMGVRGFDLLKIALKKKIPALMLTAHGLNPENLVDSVKLGAKSYIPKDKISDIDFYLKEILIAREKGDFTTILRAKKTFYPQYWKRQGKSGVKTILQVWIK